MGHANEQRISYTVAVWPCNLKWLREISWLSVIDHGKKPGNLGVPKSCFGVLPLACDDIRYAYITYHKSQFLITLISTVKGEQMIYHKLRRTRYLVYGTRLFRRIQVWFVDWFHKLPAGGTDGSCTTTLEWVCCWASVSSLAFSVKNLYRSKVGGCELMTDAWSIPPSDCAIL